MSILNAAGKFLQGVKSVTQGNLGGSLGAPNVQLLGTNIPGVPLVSFRDSFLKSMESWIGTIPLRTQYIIFFDNFPSGLRTNVIQNLEPVQADKKGFDIDRARAVLTAYPFQGINGCMFAQGAAIPDDTFQTNHAEIPNNMGLIPGLVGQGRAKFSPLTINFRETNTSFVDSLVRPWVILGAHAGMVARPEDSNLNVKTNVTIVQYTRSFQKLSQVPRKVWKFYNCVPTHINTTNLSYDSEALETYNTRWAYTHYTLEDNLYLPLPDLIDKIF
jgi:hypothetical protein